MEESDAGLETDELNDRIQYGHAETCRLKFARPHSGVDISDISAERSLACDYTQGQRNLPDLTPKIADLRRFAYFGRRAPGELHGSFKVHTLGLRSKRSSTPSERSGIIE